MCAHPDVCVVMNADDGKVLTTLPLDGGTDGGGFNPATMEAWSSQRNGTLTIIKENSPTSFAVEQTVQTKLGCKTSSLDTKNNRIVLICTERLPQAAASAAPATSPPASATNAPPVSGGASAVAAAVPATSTCCGSAADFTILWRIQPGPSGRVFLSSSSPPRTG